MAEIGYTREYQALWGKEHTIAADDLIVAQHIGLQSADIAQGVDRSGWGDQGIFWGMATNDPATGFMPKDHWLARQIGRLLYDSGVGGLDIKTQVTLLDGRPEEVVVAIPLREDQNDAQVREIVREYCGDLGERELRINGTGRFVTHGPIGDCGTTGRKLAVDFYGGNCRLGGGSPWTKDGTKADLSLNLLARAKALSYIEHHPDCPEVHCAISCRIGSPLILVVLFDRQGNELLSYRDEVSPEELIKEFRLREPRFAELCREGLFS